MLFRPRRITDDSKLYPEYVSKFSRYCANNGMSLSSAGKSDKSQYFSIGDFDPFKVSLGLFILNDSTISANLNLNKANNNSERIFEALKSAREFFKNSFDEELLFLPHRSTKVYIVGCKKDADIRDPNDWDNQFEWLCTNLETLNKVFLPSLIVAQYYEQTLEQQ